MIEIDRRRIERELAGRLSIIMREETDEAFRKKAWDGHPWAPVRIPVMQGSLLLRSGALRRSLMFRTEGSRVIVSSSMPYASIHNEGGVVTVPVSERMRRYFFALHKKTGVPRYLAMAISKQQHYRIGIPRRQFVGIQLSTQGRLDRALRGLIAESNR